CREVEWPGSDRLEPGRGAQFVGPGDLRLLARDGGFDLGTVGTPVSSDHDEHRLAVAHEAEVLHHLGQIATDRFRRVFRSQRAGRELLDPRLDSGLADELRDTLDRLRPATHVLLRSMKRT